MIHFLLVVFSVSLLTSVPYIYLAQSGTMGFDQPLLGAIIQILYSAAGAIVCVMSLKNKIYLDKLYKLLLVGLVLILVQSVFAIGSESGMGQFFGLLMFAAFWFWLSSKIKLEIPK